MLLLCSYTGFGRDGDCFLPFRDGPGAQRAASEGHEARRVRHGAGHLRSHRRRRLRGGLSGGAYGRTDDRRRWRHGPLEQRVRAAVIEGPRRHGDAIRSRVLRDLALPGMVNVGALSALSGIPPLLLGSDIILLIHDTT